MQIGLSSAALSEALEDESADALLAFEDEAADPALIRVHLSGAVLRSCAHVEVVVKFEINYDIMMSEIRFCQMHLPG